jgi:hypothetical protein
LTAVGLPADALLQDLRPETLTFRTREAILPATEVAFTLVLEGQPLALQAPLEACLVVDRDKAGLVFDCRLDLRTLGTGDLQLIALFIGKGRGSPGLERPPAAR